MHRKIKKRLVAYKKVKEAIHDEKEAIEDYRKGAKKVDSKTAKLFKHIAKDESHHHRELKKRLSKITKE